MQNKLMSYKANEKPLTMDIKLQNIFSNCSKTIFKGSGDKNMYLVHGTNGHRKQWWIDYQNTLVFASGTL